MRALLLRKYICGIVECAILSVDKKGKLKEIHTYNVATSSDAGSSHICLLEFQHSPSNQHEPKFGREMLEFGRWKGFCYEQYVSSFLL
jgi:hypothetical protein